ncbi:unnamed protein product [Cochlearia groenlandica]
MKLKIYINLMKQFRSNEIEEIVLLRSLLVLFEDYDELFRRFKEIMKEEVCDLAMYNISKALGTRFTDFLIMIADSYPQNFEYVIQATRLYLDGKMMMRELVENIMFPISDKEKLVEEFIKIVTKEEEEEEEGEEEDDDEEEEAEREMMRKKRNIPMDDEIREHYPLREAAKPIKKRIMYRI